MNTQRRQKSMDGLVRPLTPQQVPKPVEPQRTPSSLPKGESVRPQKKKRLWLLAPLAVLGIVAVVSLTLVIIAVISGVMRYRSITAEPTPSAPVARDLAALARQQQGQGDLSGAAETLTSLLEDDPSNVDATAQLALTRYRLKEYDRAVEVYTKLTGTTAQAAFAWNGIGNTYRDWASAETENGQKYLALAKDAYRNAITANSAYIAAYSNLAQLLTENGETEAAKKLLDDGINNTQNSTLQELRSRL